jgi:hypothetical protein
VPLKRRHKAPLARESWLMVPKVTLNCVFIALSALGALGTFPVNVGTPLFAWGAICCVYRAHCAYFAEYILGIWAYGMRTLTTDHTGRFLFPSGWCWFCSFQSPLGVYTQKKKRKHAHIFDLWSSAAPTLILSLWK